MLEIETDAQTIEAVVYALPEIVRAVQATRNSLSPGLRTPQVRALLRLAGAEGLTMGELARFCHTTSSAIYGMIRGDRAHFGPDSLFRFLKTIGASMQEWDG